MSRLPKAVVSRVRELEAELSTIVDGGATALEVVTPALPQLMDAGRAMSVVFGPRGDGLCVERGVVEGFPRNALDAIDVYLGSAPARWTNFDPTRPERNQRNIAFTSESFNRLLGVRHRDEAPITRNVLARFGVTDDDQCRVLVCDGPSLLAWVGAIRQGGVDDVHRRTLQRLVPALRRRLQVERLLSTSPDTRAMLDAALAAIPAPAFFTDATGRLLESNPSGLAWLEQHGADGRAALRLAVTRGDCDQFAVTPVVAPGCPGMRLLVLRPRGCLAASQCATAAARWSFTPRQAQVLVLLVQGMTTRTIAATLGTAERTIEVHLTTMFDKAQVESRAELAAAVWRDARGEA